MGAENSWLDHGQLEEKRHNNDVPREISGFEIYFQTSLGFNAPHKN